MGQPFPWGFLAWLVFAPVLVACMWDHDTLAMERSRFPSALELITGKFLRHSPEFYQWRIGDRLKRLESDPNSLTLLDDLAVAYDKTGQHDLAIATSLRAAKLQPDRYETEANLGTFLIHSGKLEEGLVHIDKALRINPDAHFGREKYQKALVEYVLDRRKANGPALPLSAQGEKLDFGKFLAKGRDLEHLSKIEGRDAIRGILGMMRFGKHDSPVLLEALANLLCPIGNHELSMVDAKQLAARAYLLAS
jgi:tetratricopeptide (TPR) repeat protein